MQIFNTLTRQKEEFVPQVPGEYRISYLSYSSCMHFFSKPKSSGACRVIQMLIFATC